MVELKFQKVVGRFGGWSFERDCHAICLRGSGDCVELRGGVTIMYYKYIHTRELNFNFRLLAISFDT